MKMTPISRISTKAVALLSLIIDFIFLTTVHAINHIMKVAFIITNYLVEPFFSLKFNQKLFSFYAIHWMEGRDFVFWVLLMFPYIIVVHS